MRCTTSLAALAVAALATAAGAAPPDPKGIEFFETKIRPVLLNKCYECHSAKSPKVKGGLLLDSRDGLLRGGDTGPALVAGKPNESLIIEALRHSDDLKMPPKEKLSDGVIADFVKWVEMGAPDPRTGPVMAYKRMTLEEAKSFYSFQPPKKAEPPKTRDASWAKSDMDRFVLAKMEEKGLKPVADAERRALVRRVYFDLIGLPPTPEQLNAALADKADKWLEKVVDELLASPHYGERWGRHWLDVARYAESNGNVDNAAFPEAWRFRDYVIDSYNRDKAFDRFVQEQIAGDLLPSSDPRQKDELLTATGFLALTSKPRAQNNPDYRMDLIADQIDTTGRAVLGLSVLCARCHDHKFDPIATKEYYALAGIFDSTNYMAGGAAGAKGNMAQPASRGLHTLSNGGQAMGVIEGKSVDCAVCIRGDTTNRGDTVPRGFLTVATQSPPPQINRSGSGRLELAQWLTRPDNPLTARVAVNRVWMHLFGRGIVASVDNFGSLGERPTHPELLDHLALQFMQEGWSFKKLVRSIVLSRTYQQSSGHNVANFKFDPDNIWLWRMTPRRLEGEAIRDAILAISGQLDPKPLEGSAVGGAGANPRRPGVATREINNRSVYLGIVRGAPISEILTVFDIASPNLVVGQRDVTTVPTQALLMMNNTFVVDQSRHLAERLLKSPLADDAARVDLVYQLAYARPPSDTERARAVSYIKQASADQKDAIKAWTSYCQVVIAAAEFRYLD